MSIGLQHTELKAQLSPREPRNTLYLLKCCPMVVPNNSNRCVSACHFLFFYLHSFVHAALHCSAKKIFLTVCSFTRCHCRQRQVRHTRSVYRPKNDKSMTDSTESRGELSTVQIRSLTVLEKCSNYQVKITLANSSSSLGVWEELSKS